MVAYPQGTAEGAPLQCKRVEIEGVGPSPGEGPSFGVDPVDSVLMKIVLMKASLEEA